MPSLFTELHRRNVFKVGAACTKMGRFSENVNVGYVRYWPKADIRTESKSPVANVCFGEKSGHSALEPGLIQADFT